MSKQTYYDMLLSKLRSVDMIICGYKATRKTRRCAKLHESCHEEAKRRVQYREFQGKLCIALDNIPLLPIENAYDGMLESCRETFKEYIFDQRGGNK